MGLRFRKSVKIAPGVRLNIGKKSVGVSAGVKGYRKSINSSGRVTTSIGTPRCWCFLCQDRKFEK
ncbi:MAG: DUF4236 domain-containing protein [Clostridium sp.]